MVARLPQRLKSKFFENEEVSKAKFEKMLILIFQVIMQRTKYFSIFSRLMRIIVLLLYPKSISGIWIFRKEKIILWWMKNLKTKISKGIRDAVMHSDLKM